MAELITETRAIKIFNPTVDQIYEALKPTQVLPRGSDGVPAPTPVYMIPKPLPPAVQQEYNRVQITDTGAAAEGAGPDQPQDNKKLLLLGAAGLGALLLMGGGKKVSGPGKKNMLVPLLIIGGAAAYYFFNKKPAEVVIPEAVAPGGSYYNPEQPSAVIEPPVPIVEQGRNSAAANAMTYLQPNWPQFAGVFPQMTDSEIVSMFQYLYAYVSFGKKLYQYPGVTGQYPDGDWNTALYNAISAIRSKYNLNI